MSDLKENTAKRYPLNISEKQVSKPENIQVERLTLKQENQ